MRFYSNSPYGGYVSPDVFKKPTNYGAIGVGLASFLGAGALGLIAVSVSKEPHARHVIPTVGLPALGAGFLGYLLRWKLDQPCPPCPGEMQAAGVPVTAVARQCPEGFYYDERAGRCIDIPV